jgi:heme A synthase
VVEGSQPGLREVIVVAAVAVAAVLGAAVLTSLLPVGVQQFVFHQPVAIAILVAGTALILWRVATRRPPEP